MGVYSTGIYGIDESTLMMHVETARNRKNAYEQLVEKLQAILDNNVKDIKLIVNNQKESFDKSYISEEGNVKKDIDVDFDNIIDQSNNINDSIKSVIEEVGRRITFYKELISNCQSAMRSAPTNEYVDSSTLAILCDLLPGKSKHEKMLERQAKTRYNIEGSNVNWYVAE